jgi:hypothetical protein
VWIFFIFDSLRFVSVQMVLSPPFSLPSTAYPLIDIVMPLRRVMLPFHRVNTSSLSMLHLSATLRPVASPLEPNLKYWICTSATGHPPCTAQLSPSTAIKMSSQPWSLPSELHPSSSFSFVTILHSSFEILQYRTGWSTSSILRLGPTRILKF